MISSADALAFGRECVSAAIIQVVEKGMPCWIKHIAIIDCLRTHPGITSANEALKRNIEEMDLGDPLGYSAYKEEFMRAQL